MQLLKTLTSIPGPSGNEKPVRDFILNYVNREMGSWKVRPEILAGEVYQDNIILVFGNPRTAVFSHIDTVGFTVRYEDQLVPIGGPEAITGSKLVGRDHIGEISCELLVDEEYHVRYKFGRPIATGTELLYKPDFRDTAEFIQSPYLDNRLGNYVALKLAETLENGIIVFSTWEEHGGGAVPFLIRELYEKYKITQALVCDITWVTEGVRHGEGVAISMRDRNIPRRAFVERIIALAQKNQVAFQIEVEGAGSSDGREIQQSPYPIDWCFVGAPEDHVHSPDEKVHKADIESMIQLYQVLMKEL
ncbi:MAG: M20/M25/M40 family metallo-hydrolase [Cyclobacteriaceae bacterium]|nr:M20/M25/M40 family metallo-hydrolase [Cyclobacteriaceae bacterium]